MGAAWRDFIAGMLGYVPIRIARGEIPIILTPTGTLSGGSNSAWPLVLGSGDSTTAQLLISNDCTLELSQWVASTSNPGYPNTLGFTVNIYWGNRQINLTPGGGVPAEMLFGTAQRPGYFGDRPWRVADVGMPGSQANIQFDITNTAGATNTIYFGIKGWRSDYRARPVSPQDQIMADQQIAAQRAAMAGGGY